MRKFEFTVELMSNKPFPPEAWEVGTCVVADRILDATEHEARRKLIEAALECGNFVRRITLVGKKKV